jgi:DNA-binding transcriptional LysR family regulator
MDFDELRAFIAVADTGSFSAAAKSLNHARATLRKRVDELESRSGVALLKRAADGVALTRAGDLFAKKGRALLGETLTLIEAVRSLEQYDQLLGIDVPVGVPHQFEQMAHRAFRRTAPSLRWKIRYTNGEFNPDTDATLVIFVGPKPDIDLRWQKTRIARVRTGLFASSEYLDRHEVIQNVEDLAGHRLFVWEHNGHDNNTLPRRQGSPLEVHPSIVSSSAHLVRQLAQSGDGICFAPASRLAGLLSSGENLQPILKDEVKGEAEMWMAVRSEVSAGAIGILANAVRGFAKAALTPLD